MTHQLLTGWQVHPSDPNYGWNPATNEVKPIQEVAAVAPPAQVVMPPPAQIVVPPPAQIVTLPAAQAAQMTFGEQDLNAAQADLERAKQRATFTGDGNFIWLMFVADVLEAILLLRFLPPWARGERKAYIESMRHRIYARLCPDPPEGRDIMYFDCLDMPGGPGGCPLCRVIMNDVVNSAAQGAADFAKEAKARPSAVWQALNLADPDSHYQEITDPQGQPQHAIVPGLFRIGPMMHNALLECFRNGDFTHMDRGFPIECIRKKTGPTRYDVDYKANHQAHHAGRIDDSVISVLYNLVDLRRECIIYNKPERMEVIAQNILSYYGSATASQVPGQIGGWIPHPSAPGWEYDPTTGSVRQAAQAPPPVRPPAPAQLPPSAQPPAPAQLSPPAQAQPPAQLTPPPPTSPPAPPAPITAGVVPTSPPALTAPPAGTVQGVIPPPVAPGIASAPVPPAQPAPPAPGMPAASVPTTPPAPAQAAPTASPPMSPTQLQQTVAAGGVAPPTQAGAPPSPPPGAPPPVMEPPPPPDPNQPPF